MFQPINNTSKPKEIKTYRLVKHYLLRQICFSRDSNPHAKALVPKTSVSTDFTRKAVVSLTISKRLLPQFKRKREFFFYFRDLLES